MTTAAEARAANPATALELAVNHLLQLQKPSGDWEGEMVWCTMILSQWVIVQRIVGRPIAAETRHGIVTHFATTQRSDGAWGLHPESDGYVFTTALAYVALRLLGLDADDDVPRRGRDWLRAQPGGVLSIPTWGKLWLALLDLYDYDGINPCPPELFVLPRWLPIHPDRYYCHTRAIYLAISYLYGRRFRADLGSTRDALRDELYGRPYATLDFARHRDNVAVSDLYVRPNPLLRVAYAALRYYERQPLKRLRARALGHVMERIVYEQRSTNYQALSPVNGLLDCIALWDEDPAHPDLARSLDGLDAWRWQDASGGIRYVGARSNTWDTSLSVQALADIRADSASASALRRAYGYLRGAQLDRELPPWPRAHREPALGGWCFSDGQHRWPVSDCTAEAVSAMLSIEAQPGLVSTEDRISRDRLRDAARFILHRQNADGGFATYERRRGPRWLEWLNPSEMFGNCMVEDSYVECTASAILALTALRRAGALDHTIDVEAGLRGAVAFLRRSQRPDGSYTAAWGINVTYALFHVVRALRAAGIGAADPTCVRAARWLIGAQRSDGGWGEHYSGSLHDRYVAHAHSQVVMTAWAILALLDTVGPAAPAVRAGIDWLRRAQGTDGAWPLGAVNGVFFGSAMLDYRLYTVYFPTWALARYHHLRSSGGTEWSDAHDIRRRDA